MKIITEAYVSFETAKLLKEKGFDEGCLCVYYDEDCKPTLPYNNEFAYKCPTQQMAMHWLREEHNIDILITLGGFIEKGKVYFCSVYKNLIRYGDLKEHLTYEDAVEAALKYSLENLI